MKKILVFPLTFSLIFIFTAAVGCHNGKTESLSSSVSLPSSSTTESAAMVSSAPNSSATSANSATSTVSHVSSKEASSIATVSTARVSTVSKASSSKTTSVVSTAPARQEVTVTIPEGYTFMQIAAILQQKGVCTESAFYQAAQSYQVQSFVIPRSADRCFNLEGYLFPDTYQFYTNDDPVNVIKKMLNDYAAKTGKPSDQVIILASILQSEARSEVNMQLVASVYLNRIKAGMKLQADPTRDYVNKYITGNALLGDTSKYAALYNTYKCAALPAGPICCPGLSAIKAAQNPAVSDYLYFFFGNDNQNHYAATFDEQQQQEAEYGVQFGTPAA